MQHRWALGHKEGRPLPNEKMVVLRKAQVQVVFEACNLRLDRCELTLKSADLPALARQQLLFPGFHNAPHVRSHAIALPRENVWHLAGYDVAPPDFCFVG